MDDRVIGIDAYNFNITGDIACTLNATSCDSPSHSGPSVIVRQEVQMDDGVIGIDLYNQSVTGVVSKALNSAATDSDHIPVVCLNFQGSLSQDQIFPVESFGHDERSTQFSKGGCCDTLTQSDHKQPIIVCYAVYDARGNGEGVVAPTITGDHQNRVTDYTAVVALALGATDANASITDGTVSPCILARAGTGGGNEPIILEVRDESISKEHRSVVREDGSRAVRTGRI